jgi:DNA-binding response OmpR family regulator
MGRAIMPDEILVVNDGSLLLQMMSCLLESRGYPLSLTDSPEEALVRLSARKVHLVILKLNGGQMDRLAVMQMVKEVNPRTKLVILGEGAHLPAEIFEIEADDYVLLPCRMAEIWRRLSRCLEPLPGKPAVFPENSRVHSINRRVVHNLRLRFLDLQGQASAIARSLELLKHKLDGRFERGVETIFQETFQSTRSLIGITEDFLQNFRHENHPKMSPGCLDLEQCDSFPRQEAWGRNLATEQHPE